MLCGLLTDDCVAAGDTYKECWPTIWEEQVQLMDAVVQTKRANWAENAYAPMDRNGYLEECYFTFSYTPLFLSDDTVGGVFTACTENTMRVIGERQLRYAATLHPRLSCEKSI